MVCGGFYLALRSDNIFSLTLDRLSLDPHLYRLQGIIEDQARGLSRWTLGGAGPQEVTPVVRPDTKLNKGDIDNSHTPFHITSLTCTFHSDPWALISISGERVLRIATV